MPGPYNTAKGRAHPVSGKARPVCMQLYQLKQLPAERGQGQLQFTPQALPTSRFGFSVWPPKHCQSVSSSFVSLPARGRVSV